MHRVNRSVPWKERAKAGLAPDLTVRECQKGDSGRHELGPLDEIGEHVVAELRGRVADRFRAVREDARLSGWLRFLTNDEVIVSSPDQMKRQADIEHAGMLASIGQDLDLMSFQVADIARRFNATRAQKYGRVLIEELIEVGSGETQVFESADRGLDSLTRFSVVGDAERVGPLSANRERRQDGKTPHSHRATCDARLADGSDQTLAASSTGVDLTSAAPSSDPALPHERDEKVGMTGGGQSSRVQQGARDLKRGIQDTSRAPETDDAYKKLKK